VRELPDPERVIAHVSQGEPTMMSLKILSAAAIVALAVPVIDSTASHAQGISKPAGGGGVVGGGGGPRMGGGGGGPHFHGGGGGPRFNGGGGPRFGGGYGGGWHRGGGGGGFVPGLIAGGIIGGALAAPGGYYGNSYGYYGSGYGPYYGGPYDDGGEVVEVAPSGGDDVAYCMQTYKSYNPRTGTYLGYDGLRHACP
jgi:hypothetical protein